MSIFEGSRSYRPFKYPWAVAAAEQHSIDMFWDKHQVELQDDIRQYNSRDGLQTKDVSHDTNKYIIDTLLCLFTEMDVVVGEGYTQLIPYVGNNEIRNLLLTQAAREITHQRSYALLAETFGFSNEDWEVFREYKEMVDKLSVMGDSVGDLSVKLNWAKKLTQVLLGEGIGLFSAFACLLNFKRQGLLMGFNDVNQWSLADEEFHVKNNIRVLKEVITELSQEELGELKEFTFNLCDNYCEAELTFIDLLYDLGEPQDLKKQDLIDYLNYLGKLRLYQLGYIPREEVPKNTLEWMEWMLSGRKLDNFFEKKVTEYTHSKLPGKIDYSKYKLKGQ